MPLSKLHVPRTLDSDLCRSIGHELHACLVDTCGVGPDDNFCLVSRYGDEDRIIHPSFLGERDPGNTIFVEITWLVGRSPLQKEALYSVFRERLTRIGWDQRNTVIFLVENRLIDWSFNEVGSLERQLGRTTGRGAESG